MNKEVEDSREGWEMALSTIYQKYAMPISNIRPIGERIGLTDTSQSTIEAYCDLVRRVSESCISHLPRKDKNGKPH